MNRLKDAIYGLAVGDAMGLPVQSLIRGEYNISEMIGYGYSSYPAGSWSDDTSLTIATCDSIRENKGIDIHDIKKKFKLWLSKGEYTPFGEAYDIGETCFKAIVSSKGLDAEHSCGNGSLMRIIPLAFIDDITDETIAQVSAITHAHPRCQEGCIIYVRIAQGLLKGYELRSLIKEYVKPTSEFKRLLAIENLNSSEISSSGYIISTFEAAIWCLLTTNSYKDCIIKAVNLGDDTDTVAAVAGALAGIIYGYDAIPKDWINKLQAKEKIEACFF